jgi:hypothetical protein
VNLAGEPPAASPVHVVMPGDVDDATVPSGGNTYDRRVCAGLAAARRPVREIAVPGAWPRPDAEARAGLDRALAAVPDGALVLVDGLVGCGVPDIVVPHARRLRLAVLVHMPLGDGTATGHAAKLNDLERATLRAANAVVATSRWAARRLVDRHGLAEDRVHIAPPGTDPAPLASGSGGAPRLLCVASVSAQKGHDLLVEALAAVADLPWTCECVGALRRDPAFVARLQELIDARGLGDRVRLTGPRTGKELAAVYAAADLAVLASRGETYGMVVTEALARGLPVLATAVGGVPEALGRDPYGNVPGLLTPPEDPQGISSALRHWLTDPDLRRRLIIAARHRRGRLEGWEMTARILTGVLERLRGEPQEAPASAGASRHPLDAAAGSRDARARTAPRHIAGTGGPS